MRGKLTAFLMVASLAFIASSASHAGDLIVSNLATPTSSYATVQPYDPQSGLPGFAIAQEFTTGVGTALEKIVVNIGDYDKGTSGDTVLTAKLFADNSGSPTGALLSQFTFNAGDIPASGFADVAFLPTSTVMLAPGSGYWFALFASSSDGGGVDWSIADTNALVGTGGLPAYTESADGGSTWDPASTPTAGFPPFRIAIYGAIPEPTSWIMGCIGFASVTLISRFSRSRRRAG
jgi:hypothetical protein